MTGLLATKPRPADVPALAEAALWQELELTPKPGLVDRLNNGSHRDMDHALFVRSIAAITPWFSSGSLCPMWPAPPGTPLTPTSKTAPENTETVFW